MWQVSGLYPLGVMHPTISPSNPLWEEIFNPTLQLVFIPANLAQSFSFSLDTTLVNMSAGFSSVWIFSNSNDCYSITSLNQWYLTSVCFEREWYIEFLLKSIAFWLSQLTTYPSCFKPNSWRNRFNQSISLPASLAVIYSASVVDKTTHFCNLDYHDTAPPAKVNKYPDVNFLPSMSPTQFAST